MQIPVVLPIQPLLPHQQGVLAALDVDLEDVDTVCSDFLEELVHRYARELLDTAVQQNLGALPIALCEASREFFLGERSSSPAALIEGAQQVRRSREAGFGFILAAGLFRTLHKAEAEGDLARRDDLLDELRALARSFPDDAAVRDLLAGGLSITLDNAKAEGDLARRDDLLDELHALARSFPDDAAVRVLLAGGCQARCTTPRPRGISHAAMTCSTNCAAARSFPDDAALRELVTRCSETGIGTTLPN
jgi:hypothetical protein